MVNDSVTPPSAIYDRLAEVCVRDLVFEKKINLSVYFYLTANLVALFIRCNEVTIDNLMATDNFMTHGCNVT